MKKLLKLPNLQKGFTLIELLIVIGILGILVVAVLLTLNPAEAQRRTRDEKRMKDLTTIQAAVQQWIDGAGVPPSVQTTWCSASVGTCTGIPNTSCATGWLGLAGGVCNYVSTLPLDSNNGADRNAVNSACPSTGGLLRMAYRVTMSPGAAYEVNVRQESLQNCANVNNDGGNSNQWVESGSDLTLIGN